MFGCRGLELARFVPTQEQKWGQSPHGRRATSGGIRLGHGTGELHSPECFIQRLTTSKGWPSIPPAAASGPWLRRRGEVVSLPTVGARDRYATSATCRAPAAAPTRATRPRVSASGTLAERTGLAAGRSRGKRRRLRVFALPDLTLTHEFKPPADAKEALADLTDGEGRRRNRGLAAALRGEPPDRGVRSPRR